MKLFSWSADAVSGTPRISKKTVPDVAPSPDPRAVRYFSIAARYNSAAAELGYLSLEHAVRAGARRMPDVLRMASSDEHADRPVLNSPPPSERHTMFRNHFSVLGNAGAEPTLRKTLDWWTGRDGQRRDQLPPQGHAGPVDRIHRMASHHRVR